MKTIIAGSRTITKYTHVAKAIDDAQSKGGITITEVISGGADGVDRIGEEWAKKHRIPLRIVKADWRKHGKQAGILRNAEMAKHADALIAVWDSISKGTEHMISQATRAGLKVYIHRVDIPYW